MKAICLECCEVGDVPPFPLRLINTLRGHGFSQREAADLIVLKCLGCDAQACCCPQCEALAKGERLTLALGTCPNLERLGRRRVGIDPAEG